jgi:GAF domain-containing protein
MGDLFTMDYIKKSDWAANLEHLYRVATLVTAAHDVDTALQTIIDSAREITGAELGAIGVPGERGKPMAHFITSGLPDDAVIPLAHPPIGRGVLSVLLREGKTVRLTDIRHHPYYEGWPAGHPMLDSFLGVPIQFNGEVVGDLYLGNKMNGEPFSEEDQRLIEMLAAHAAVVIQSLRDHEKTQQLAIMREREAIAAQLQDDVLQAMYGVGLLMGTINLNQPEQVARDLHDIRMTFDDAIERLRLHLTELASGS